MAGEDISEGMNGMKWGENTRFIREIRSTLASIICQSWSTDHVPYLSRPKGGNSDRLTGSHSAAAGDTALSFRHLRGTIRMRVIASSSANDTSLQASSFGLSDGSLVLCEVPPTCIGVCSNCSLVGVPRPAKASCMADWGQSHFIAHSTLSPPFSEKFHIDPCIGRISIRK